MNSTRTLTVSTPNFIHLQRTWILPTDSQVIGQQSLTFSVSFVISNVLFSALCYPGGDSCSFHAFLPFLRQQTNVKDLTEWCYGGWSHTKPSFTSYEKNIISNQDKWLGQKGIELRIQNSEQNSQISMRVLRR